MTDTKKLIEFLDDQIERSEKFCKSEWAVVFTEIKGTLEQQRKPGVLGYHDVEKFYPPDPCKHDFKCDKCGEQHSQPSDDELVEEIISKVDYVKSLDGEDAEYLRAEIHKLLQGQGGEGYERGD